MVLESNVIRLETPARSPLITLDRLSLTIGLRQNSAGKVLSPGTRLFEQVSWQLDPGDHAAIVGPSGSGKTSLLRLLNRLISPTTGQICWRGQPYDTIPVAQIRRDVVYVSQVPKLLGMTVADAIAYPLRLRQIREAEIQSRLTELCDRLDIPSTWLTKTELQLSQASQQWVSLARGLIVVPPVLLLDDPAATLDAAQQQRLTQVLQALQATTLVIASHDRAWSQDMTQTTLHLTTAQGTPQRDGMDEDW